MPYKSAKQAAYFHAQKGKKIPAAVVNEFDAASAGKKLPKKAKAKVPKKAAKPGMYTMGGN